MWMAVGGVLGVGISVSSSVHLLTCLLLTPSTDGERVKASATMNQMAEGLILGTGGTLPDAVGG